MRLKTLLWACGVLFSEASTPGQGGGATTDIISGSWGTNGLPFLELKYDGKGAVSGTTIWRVGSDQESRAPVKSGTFDPKTAAFKLEGEAKRPTDGTVVRFIIEGKIDKDTATGFYDFGGNKGDFTFTRLSV